MNKNGNPDTVFEHGWLRIYPDGSACIAYDADAYEGGECTVPAPGLSELEIDERVQRQKRAIWMQGMWVERVWRKRNPVFDRGKERTTTVIRFRVCRSATEAKFVLSKVKEMAGIAEEEHAPQEAEDQTLEAAAPSTSMPAGEE